MKTLKHILKAAEQEDAFAQFLLGVMYANGEGVPKDYVEAAKWLRKAAEQDHKVEAEITVEAMRELGSLYASGAESGGFITGLLAPDSEYEPQGFAEAEAKAWLRKAAKREGREWAAWWYRKAAFGSRTVCGDAEAQFKLGFMYKWGEGVHQDDVWAMKFYRMAAEQGHVEAQYRLGLMYRKGHDEAFEWFRKAAEQGHAKAQNKLDRMQELQPVSA